VKCQASTLDQSGHLKILMLYKARWILCTWARSHRDRHYHCSFYIYTFLMYTRSIKAK